MGTYLLLFAIFFASYIFGCRRFSQLVKIINDDEPKAGIVLIIFEHVIFILLVSMLIYFYLDKSSEARPPQKDKIKEAAKTYCGKYT